MRKRIREVKANLDWKKKKIFFLNKRVKIKKNRKKHGRREIKVKQADAERGKNKRLQI